jgi:hypothetical protein
LFTQNIYKPVASEGLKYSYYEGSWSQLPDFNKLTPKKTGTVSNFSLSPRIHNDNFAMIFSGYILIPASGTYTFYTNSDDGSQVYINNTLIVNNNGLHAAREQSGKVYLQQGKHAIKVSFFERTGNQILDVYYSGGGISKRRVPSNILSIDTNARIAKSKNDKTEQYIKGMSFGTDSDVIDFKVYPVPFAENINLKLHVAEKAKYDFIILDIAGKILFNKSYLIDKGTNELSIVPYEVSKEGVYMLNVYQNGILISGKKIVKK